MEKKNDNFYTSKLGRLNELERHVLAAQKVVTSLVMAEKNAPGGETEILEGIEAQLQDLFTVVNVQIDMVAPMAEMQKNANISNSNARLAALRVGPLKDRCDIISAYCARFGLRYSVVDLHAPGFNFDVEEWDTTVCGSFVTDTNCTHALVCMDEDGVITVLTPADAAEGGDLTPVNVNDLLSAIASGKKLHVKE